MIKIKLTKGELKRQRDALKQYRHYLPTLQLKKQQLQMKILEARRLLEEKLAVLGQLESDISAWVGLLADPELASGAEPIDLKKWITPKKVEVLTLNIAGANVPFIEKILFPPIDYDFYATPFWLDQGVKKLREFVDFFIHVLIVRRQIEILEQELRITTQRVNLFEKIKIPECLENIRKIRIYLGDQQANAVGISKVAKKKVEGRELEEAFL